MTFKVLAQRVVWTPSLLLVTAMWLGTFSSAKAQSATTDETIQGRLERIFATIPDFSGVSVSVQEGVVQLSGTTLSSAAQNDALELAATLDGVIYVVDNLEQEADLGRTLRPALARLQDYATAALRYSPLVLVAVTLIAFFWFLAALVGRWAVPFQYLRLNPLLQSLVQQLIRAALVLTGVLLALDLLGATAVVTAVLGTAGLAGLALGFAFRDIVENYLAGVLLSLRQPFNIGDHLLLESFEGRVVRLTARELVLMTLDGNHVRIPNSVVFNGVTINYTRNPRRRFDFEVTVDRGEDIETVKTLGTQALLALPGVLHDPKVRLRVQALSDAGVTFRVLGWVDQRQADFLKVRSEALKAIKEAFERAGVQLPEPVATVQLQRLKVEKESEVAPPQTPVPQHAEPVDVSPETDLDAQIAEELADPDEPNLLEPRREKR